MRKRFAVYSLILLICFALIILKYFCVEIVYVNPNVNTSVFPYISKTIKLIDDGLNYAVSACKSENDDIKLVYKNAYGSGFLKENPIPNDLDYSVGVHLGHYKYDGTNGAEIAADIYNKIFMFQNAYYDYFLNYQNDKFYTDTSVLNEFFSNGNKRRENIKTFVYSLDKIFQDKDYINFTKKELYVNEYIDYPFILKSDEILMEDFPPVTLRSDSVVYSKSDKKYQREVTVIIDYFVDIENTKLNKTKTVEIVAESFTGQRLQLYRRFFVPNIFTGEDSAAFLKNLSYLNNNDEYFEYRLLNLRRHLQEIQNLDEFSSTPVKMFKRVHQCVDLISPMLNETQKNDIYKKINENLSNKDVQLLNTYSNALDNLTYFMLYPDVYAKAYDNGMISELINVMNESVEELMSRANLDNKKLEQLTVLNNNIKTKLRSIRTEHELYIYSLNLYEHIENDIKPVINSMYDGLIKYKKDLQIYTSLFFDIYEKAGFHKVDLYWLDKNTLGVLKDDYTKKLKPEELKKIAEENNLVDVNYRFMSEKEIVDTAVRYSVWVRYKSSEEENENFENLKSKLIEDKKNFKIRRKLIFNPKFYF